MMNLRWKIALVLVVLVIGGAVLLFLWPDSAQTALEETRRDLRQQGFKIDLAEFDFSVSAEQSARATVLTNADQVAPAHSGKSYARGTLLSDESLNLMKAAGADTAIVVWKQEKLPLQPDPYFLRPGYQPVEDLWAALREVFDESRAVEDAACAAALSGPIRFHLNARHGSSMSLPHLGKLKSLAQMLGMRAVLELHDGYKVAAWTNVLASTRLVTAWDPEPPEISQMVRHGCAGIVYNATWEALQAGGWSDDRLARLQREWESVDFLKGLPETEAFARAAHADTCQRERQEPLPPSLSLTQMRLSPRYTWTGLIERWRRVRYRHHGSYEDERALLLYHRDRELQFRRAIQASTWLEMRQLPGITNSAPFRSNYSSRMQMLLNMSQIRMGFARQGRGLFGQATEAEARRRLLITAIALERYHGRHGAYPQSLQALVPELLQYTPIDFMDGQPLRYRLTEDGHFVLYSVGMDCADNGGEMRRPRRRELDYQGSPDFGAGQQGPDLVWPRPASEAEVQAQKEEEARQAESNPCPPTLFFNSIIIF